MDGDMQDKAHVMKVRFGRRVFLGILGAGAFALALGRQVSSLVGERFSSGGSADDVNGFFRYYNVSGTPQIAPQEWRLTVDGLVENPTTWDLEQFKSLPGHSQRTNFECVTGWVVKNVPWRGVRIETILDIVKPRPQARFITFYSAESPYKDSLSLPQAREKGVMLAYEMKREPLTQEQGWPLRLLSPPMYGYKSVKWLVRMEFTEEQAIGYWEQEGYPVDAYLGTPAPFFPGITGG